MKKRVKQLVAIILSSAMVMSLAACGTSETETESSDATSAEATETVSTDADEGTPVLGGSVTLRYTEFYGEYDPGACNNRACNTFMYDMLWNLDWETDPDEFTFAGTYLSSDYLTGQVAESWEVADDYTSITVHLRDDVYFQDKVAAGFDEEYDIYKGRQLVADDVKFSYARLIGIDGYEQVELDQTNWSNDLAMLESIEVVDDQTLIFYLNTNTQVGVNSFMCARVQLAGPEWDELTSEQKVDWQYASGTGPFILQNYVTDNTMTFVKNPNYWQTDSDGVQLPYLDEVNLVYFADAETTMASFISGDIDAVITSGTYFNADETQQISTALGEDYYTNTYYAAPMSIGLKQGSNPVEALTDVRVRKALQYAIDLEALSDYMGYGYTEEDELKSKISSLFSSNTEWSNIDNWDDEMLESYTTYDPEKAKELLAEVGYADGFDFEVTIFSMLPTELFQLVSEYLAEVGVNMTVTVGNTPQDMTSVGGDETNPSCVFYTIGGDSVSGVGMSILRDGQTNYIKQNESIIDELATTFINATSTDEQIEAAHALDDEYMSQHYVLLITYCERYQSFFRSSFHGLKGGTPLANYYYGYMLARCWTDN